MSYACPHAYIVGRCPHGCRIVGGPTLVVGRRPIAAHPYRHPAASRNGPCLDCGAYEEDGPHAAAEED